MEATGTVTGSTDRSLYDVAPLLPWIDAGATLLTPNLRLSRYLRQAWDARQQAAGKGAWPTLAAHAVEHWLQARWQRCVLRGALAPRRCLGNAEELLLWEQVISDCTGPESPFSLLQPRVAARSAQQARDYLLRWQVGLHDPATRQQFQLDGDGEAFLAWSLRFQERLDRDELATPADCLLALATATCDSVAERVLLVECDELSPLVEHVLSRQCASLEAYRRPAREVPVATRCYSDERAESRAIARWCADTARSAPGSRIGVVLADTGNQRRSLDYFLRREFACLDAPYAHLPVNYSAGITLDRAPLVRDALAVLSLLGQRIDRRSLEQVVESRFVPLADRDSPTMAHHMQRIRELGAAQLDSGLLRELTNSPLPGSAPDAGGASEFGRRLLSTWQRVSRLRARAPSEWAETFTEVLADWRWIEGARLDSLEYQQWTLWQETLDALAALDAIAPQVDLEQALRLLEQCCGNRIFQPKTDDSDIQVLGPLEAAGLAFDAIWVAGMQEGLWPAPARPNPFIPISLQRQLDMPGSSARREWAFAGNLIARYHNAAGQLHMSYTLERDGSPVMPSALVPRGSAIPQPVAEEGDWLPPPGTGGLETFVDKRAPVVSEAEKTRVRGGSSLVKNQSACPFRAFAIHRLQLQPPVENDLALTAQERGTLLHAALYTVWGRLGDSATLQRCDEAQRRELTLEAAQAAVAGFNRWRRRVVGDALLRLEIRRLAAVLLRWLQLETERPVAFVVEGREETRTITIGDLALELRVDRIDRLGDDGRLILDYKSGGGSVADWLGERPVEPQLPLYASLEDEPLAGIAFAAVNRDNPGFVGLADTEYAAGISADIARAARNRDSATSWDELRASWHGRLEALVRAFVSGEAAVQPLSVQKTCRYCGLQPLCRVGVEVTGDVGPGE